MLGRRVVQEAEQRGHTVNRSEYRVGKLNQNDFSGEVIINCAGSIPLRKQTPHQVIESNTVLPWALSNLAELVGMHLIHMSTDCVFSGQHRNLHSDVLPDPDSLYGRMKLAGEPSGDHVTVVRGSFIGTRHGFVPWVLTAENLQLWSNAYWNGGSDKAMARALIDLAESEKPRGVVHVAARVEMSKAAMAHVLIRELNVSNTSVTHSQYPRIWRKLEPDILLPSVIESLNEIIEEVRYDRGNS